jgi:hypothetical protein
MERNCDEVIADMLIQLADIEQRRIKHDVRLAKFDRRVELTIKRMVSAETRLERLEKISEKRAELAERNAMILNEKLEASLKAQAKVNKYFLDFIKKNPL